MVQKTPGWLGNEEDAIWPAVATLNAEVVISHNILVIFGDFLIYPQ